MNSCKLTIFEGPDGAGKTTAAKQFVKDTGAMYVHFPALPLVSTGLARMYVEAMIPALLGHQDVVFDRCWLSELPYATVFREGQNRINLASVRMLERLAMRCETVVVKCLPKLSTVVNNFNSRREEELLDSVGQLTDIYYMYERLNTDLPMTVFNYEDDRIGRSKLDYDLLNSMRTHPHFLGVRSAGNIKAKIILVGDKFGRHKNEDAFYQWPFGSFSRAGCSQWLTMKLQLAKISERELCWVNSDDNLSLINWSNYKGIFALGNSAKLILNELDVESSVVNHPQHHKRFGLTAPYPLTDLIKQVKESK